MLKKKVRSFSLLVFLLTRAKLPNLLEEESRATIVSVVNLNSIFCPLIFCSLNYYVATFERPI